MSNVTQYIDKSFIPPMVWNILLLIVIAGGVWVVWGLLKKTKHLVKAVITAVLLGVLMGGIHFNNWMDYKHLDSASVVVDGQSIPIRGIQQIEISGSQAKITYRGKTYTIYNKDVVNALKNYSNFAKK